MNGDQSSVPGLTNQVSKSSTSRTPKCMRNGSRQSTTNQFLPENGLLFCSASSARSKSIRPSSFAQSDKPASPLRSGDLYALLMLTYDATQIITHYIFRNYRFCPDFKVKMDKITDCDGCDMAAFKHKNMYYPPWATTKSIERVKELEMRSDDILLLTYPKSGTHWIHEIIRMLVSGTSEAVEGTKAETFLEMPFVTPEALAQLDPPRVMNTHLHFDSIPSQLKEKRPRLIFAFRNPKDVIVSYYHHTKQMNSYNYEGSFHAYLSLCLEGRVTFGSWFDYNLEAEKFIQENKDLPILTLYYEDMKEDLPKAIREIADFLELPCSVDLLTGITDKATFSNLKKSKDTWANEKSQIGKMFKSGKFEMFRKGMVGDWKNYFTVADNENFDNIYSEKMANSSLRIRFEL